MLFLYTIKETQLEKKGRFEMISEREKEKGDKNQKLWKRSAFAVCHVQHIITTFCHHIFVLIFFLCFFPSIIPQGCSSRWVIFQFIPHYIFRTSPLCLLHTHNQFRK
jgi:hypothetical protein